VLQALVELVQHLHVALHELGVLLGARQLQAEDGDLLTLA
jgi:hypothetical protein